MNFFKSNLKALRIIRGKSQKQISEALGVPRSTYSRWENGKKNNPTIDQLIRIAKYYHITLDSLLKSDYKKEIIKKIKAT